MKYLTNIFLLLIFGTSVAFAGPGDKVYTTSSGTVMHEGASRDCIVIRFADDDDDVRDAWEDYMEDKYDVDLDGRDLMEAEEIQLAAVTDKTMDLYTMVSEDDNGVTTMKVFGRVGYDLYLEDNAFSAAFDNLEDVVEDFTVAYLPEYFKSEIDNVKDELEDLIDERDDVMDDIEDKQEEIADNNEDIAELRAEIAELEAENAELRTEINACEKVVVSKNASIEQEKANLRLLRGKHKDVQSK